MKKRSFENSIENNQRKAFYQNAKDNFKTNLAQIPRLAGVYLATTLLIQFLRDEPMDIVFAIGSTVMFSFLILLLGPSKKR